MHELQNLVFLCSAVAVAGAAARGAVGPDVSCVVFGVAPCAVANFLVHCFALHCLFALRCLLAFFLHMAHGNHFSWCSSASCCPRPQSDMEM